MATIDITGVLQDFKIEALVSKDFTGRLQDFTIEALVGKDFTIMALINEDFTDRRDRLQDFTFFGTDRRPW